MQGFALNDIFKIGIGPSSSHTMGPMHAAQHFLSELESRAEPGPFKVQVTLHGSLAATGDGHGTPGAVTAGLMGYHYETVTLPDIEAAWIKSATHGHLVSLAGCTIEFNGEKDLIRDTVPLAGHPNGMTFVAWKGDEQIAHAQYFSVGGGMVEDHNRVSLATAHLGDGPAPFPYRSMDELVALCEREKLSIAELQARNEHLCLRREEFDPMSDKLWRVMSDCIDRGLSAEGELPGGLKVKDGQPHYGSGF